LRQSGARERSKSKKRGGAVDRGINTQCRADSMLAFLLCLCLAVVGVVGDLTDADFAKIGSLLDKRDERLYTELGTLKSTIDALETKFDAKFDALETKFDALETKFDALNTTLSNKIDVLDTKIDDIKFELSKNHFFNRIRIDVLKNVSGNFAHCINPDGSPKHSGTRHTVVYKGRVATLFTPHSDCLNSHAFSPTNNGKYILHPTLDLAIDLSCLPTSSTPSALDLSSVFVPSLGDEIIAFGFGETAFVWQGLVAAFTSESAPEWNCSSKSTHWKGTTSVRVCRDEIVAQGHQHAGMSGAPVLNGCGYVGMAHAMTTSYANYAYIIRASDIIALIEKHHSQLPTLAECGQSAVAPPLAAFANCVTNTPLTPLQIIINANP